MVPKTCSYALCFSAFYQKDVNTVLGIVYKCLCICIQERKHTHTHTSISYMYIFSSICRALPLNRERMTNSSLWLVDYHNTNSYKWKLLPQLILTFLHQQLFQEEAIPICYRNIFTDSIYLLILVPSHCNALVKTEWFSLLLLEHSLSQNM